MDRCQQIIDHCISLSDEFVKKYGASSVGRIYPNLESLGINLNSLSQEEAAGLAAGLVYSSSQTKSTMIFPVHLEFWDALGKHLLQPPSLYFGETHRAQISEGNSSVRDLFLTVIKTFTGEWEMQPKFDISGWRWPRDALMAKAQVSYLVFPLLEAVLKRYLSDFISTDGLVLKPFEVRFDDPGKPGKKRFYKKDEDHISQVRHMLILLYEKSDGPLRYGLQAIFNKIEALYPGQSADFVIGNVWRNPIVHGSGHTKASDIVVLHLILLVATLSVANQAWEERIELEKKPYGSGW